MTGDHYLLATLEALAPLRNRISAPIIVNCSGWYAEENLSITAQFADIFLYDLKYSDEALAVRYSRAGDYVARSYAGIDYLASRAIPWIEEGGLLESGVIIRHMMLPGYPENTEGVLRKVAALRDAGMELRLSLMCQYFPAFRSGEYPELDTKVTEEEYERAVALMDSLDIDGWIQEMHEPGNC